MDRPRLDLLVTGFGPFPRVRVNPTDLLARDVARRLARSGSRARALVLETSYRGGLPRLAAVLDEDRPRAVLMLGLAARARFVRVELFGRPRPSPLHPDASGRTPGMAAVGTGGPLRTSANTQGALARLRRAALRARLSPSAGAYLCNAAYAAALAATRGAGVPVLFVHVPWPRPAAGTRRRAAVAAFRPGAAALERAFVAIGRDLIVVSRNRQP